MCYTGDMANKSIQELILMARRYANDAHDEAMKFRPDAPLADQHAFPSRGYWASEEMCELWHDVGLAWTQAEDEMERLSTRLDRALSGLGARQLDNPTDIHTAYRQGV